MKKHIPFLLLFLMSLSFFGQDRQNKHQEIHAAKVSFITNKLSLTTKQAEKFWPIYNTSRKEIFKLHREKKSLIHSINFKTIDNETCKKIIAKIDALENEIHIKKTASNTQLLGAISHIQLLKLKLAEFKFKRRLLKQIQKKDAKKHF